MAIECNHYLHDCVGREQTPESMVDRAVQSSSLVHLDSRFCELGTTTDEHRTLGSLRTQPSEVEKADFEGAIWKAFAQCFVTYEEAIQAIQDFNLGTLVA